MKYKYKYKYNPLKYIIIKIIPKEMPNIQYIYTPKNDIYQLIYNLGGIACLWFGISGKSILLSLLKLYSNAPLIYNIVLQFIILSFKTTKYMICFTGKIVIIVFRFVKISLMFILMILFNFVNKI